jgi:acyl phosphate:glycerol-3-phosphate acyltransferase
LELMTGPMPYIIGAIAGGYLLGSIPFGLVLTRLAGLGDIRAIGSGNIGATNVLRTGRKDLAALTLLLDAGKGTAAVLLGDMYGPDIAVLAAIAAFIGHLYPVWLGFKGGKGVATYIGILAGLAWPYAVLFCALWLAVAVIGRRSSLSALTAGTVTALLSWFMSSPTVWFAGNAALVSLLITRQRAEVVAAMTLLVFWRHRANIGRLLKGEEPKIGAGR